MIFLSQVETSKVYLRDTTVISPYDLLLFGGTINVQHQACTHPGSRISIVLLLQDMQHALKV